MLQSKHVCNVPIFSKDNDSKSIAKLIKKKFNSISKLRLITTTREEAITAYLLFEIYPTSTKRYENMPEITPIKNKLYSISQIAKLGAQTIFAQNKKLVTKIIAGTNKKSKRFTPLST